MKDKIIVIGGYGQVGQIISKDLGELFPGKVFAAGRSYRKAKEFCDLSKGNVQPLQVNVNENFLSDHMLKETLVVVMCLDQQNTQFMERCFQHHIHYVDITASYEFLTKVRNIKLERSPLQSSAVLSVGLAPGLTNMLVKHTIEQMDEVNSADIYIMMGVGDQHGKAGIKWMINNLDSEFPVIENGVEKQVRSFENGLKTEFPNHLGHRKAFRFNFTDQHVLPHTLGIGSVSTRLCFDSIVLTNLIALFKKVGVFRLLKIRFLHQITLALFEKLSFGGDIWVIKVKAEGYINSKKAIIETSLHGHKESFITGKVAGFVAKELYMNKYPQGIFHIEELFQPKELFKSLRSYMKLESI
ncbi:saccharopine dehydrogenase family protein [Chengkuizengella axinellae]|uniref:Saccharopine dehydrogenase NADP-binding domain-containing protein n=1 Tax=Chengkuizengella axinellae TaxID=3064388 RepID=A0ABT9IYV8_9BACL|nr:saccharopine dehydrogenase NADP-binding domain-containing protein [Chengkuizengella sp. 2205SS18-9]MDP5274554.1 saccharopine dehydrogenase NADP-binding domain-containing protein [Chengkuizengella sp. 2205SS18-9]